MLPLSRFQKYNIPKLIVCSFASNLRPICASELMTRTWFLRGPGNGCERADTGIFGWSLTPSRAGKLSSELCFDFVLGSLGPGVFFVGEGVGRLGSFESPLTGDSDFDGSEFGTSGSFAEIASSSFFKVDVAIGPQFEASRGLQWYNSHDDQGSIWLCVS